MALGSVARGERRRARGPGWDGERTEWTAWVGETGRVERWPRGEDTERGAGRRAVRPRYEKGWRETKERGSRLSSRRSRSSLGLRFSLHSRPSHHLFGRRPRAAPRWTRDECRKEWSEWRHEARTIETQAAPYCHRYHQSISAVSHLTIHSHLIPPSLYVPERSGGGSGVRKRAERATRWA